MAKTKKKTTKENLANKASEVNTINNVAKDILNRKENKNLHYNYEEEQNYKVSSGSLILDCELDGGIGPGLHRFCGINEGGKTSCSFSFMHNFLKAEGRRGIYIKAEGRLSDEMQKRSGIKFVWDPDKWEDGTCFVLETNVQEVAFDLMRELIMQKDDKKNFFFILDSVDGLIPRGDIDKDFSDAAKVAGGAVISGNLMKKVSIAMAKRGHVCVFISQVRADIKLDPYTKEPVRQTTATGGNALLHFANWIFEFEPRFGGDIITDNNEKYKPGTNKIIGHWAKITIKKSPNETTNNRVQYPIRHGRLGGCSIWSEREIEDTMFIYGVATKSGAWINFDEDFISLIRDSGYDFPDKVQGSNKLSELLEKNSGLKNFLVEYFRKIITSKENAIQNDMGSQEESQENMELSDRLADGFEE